MKKSKKKKLIAISAIIIIALVGFGVWNATRNKKRPVVKANKITGAKAEAEKSQAPDTSDHLKIDSIGVDAKIISVGLTKEGNMEAPASVKDVGWYKNSSKFGSTGTAVLAGHYDGANGDKGVFYSLNKLKSGDEIVISKYNGPKITYKVTKTKIYTSTDKPSEVFNSSSGSHLNLITCTGSWDKNKDQYDKRLVVFTNLVK